MSFLHDDVFDSGLSQLDTLGDRLYICSQEPTTFTEASSTYALGNKDALSIGAPVDRTGGGRKVTVAAITDGAVTATGTASHWAIVDVSAPKLLATDALSASEGVTSGNTFTLNAFDIGIPDPS